MESLEMKFSIVIPYHALPATIDFVKKQLNYYHHNPTQMAVILAVSGDVGVKIELANFLKDLNDPRFAMLTTSENNITNWGAFLSKILAALKNVTTPYVILNGADDVVIPEAASEAAEILSNNLDIAAVKGYTVCFDCDSGRVLILKGSEILDSDPINRIKDAFKDQDSIFYITRRTADLIVEYENIITLLNKSEAVRYSPYHIEHFIALSVASLGKVCLFKYPWRLANGHKNNHTSHTEGSFLRVKNGVLDQNNYSWFQSVNKNMQDLSYKNYKFLWITHQIRGISVTLKQIAYHFLYKKCGLINSIKILSYYMLNKIYLAIKKIFPNGTNILNNNEHFFKAEHYAPLKKYYFSERDAKLIESKVWQ